MCAQELNVTRIIGARRVNKALQESMKKKLPEIANELDDSIIRRICMQRSDESKYKLNVRSKLFDDKAQTEDSSKKELLKSEFDLNDTVNKP